MVGPYRAQFANHHGNTVDLERELSRIESVARKPGSVDEGPCKSQDTRPEILRDPDHTCYLQLAALGKGIIAWLHGAANQLLVSQVHVTCRRVWVIPDHEFATFFFQSP